MADPYTPDPADVELIEDAWLSAAPCAHGTQPLLDSPAPCSECSARDGLAALAASGRLQTAGGKQRTEYNLRFRGGASGRWVVDDAITSPEPENDWVWTRDNFGDDCHQVHRTVTTYPDGSTLIGPWLPAPTTEGDDRA